MSTRKHITFIGLNFYPESTAIGLYSTQLVAFLEEQGYDISVITAFPYYPHWKIAREYQNKPRFFREQRDNTKIYRYKQYTPAKPTFLKRVLHIIDFTVGSYFNLRKIKKSDLVIAIIPFTSAAFLGGIAKRRFNAKLWVHIQDFEFDAAFQSGLMQPERKNKGWIHKLLMRLERRILNKADTVSTISQSMIQMLSQKTKQPTYFLPNWVSQEQVNLKNNEAHPYLQSKKFKILYSGNVGDKQDWSFFLEFADHIDKEHFEIIVVGAGSQRDYIAQEIKKRSAISLYPPVPYEELSSLLASADVHILFQKATIRDTVMPSKILGMMASNKPSIITGHPDSEVAMIIRNSECGFYSSKNEPSLVLEQLDKLFKDNSLCSEMGAKARKYVTEHYAKDEILKNFNNALNQL